MHADLWKKIEEFYHEALALPPEKRAAFLEQACPDDPLVRREVESLLAEKAASFFETAPMSASPALGAGTKLGNFEIVSLLGRGGMGEVWRARDSRLKREVAIKTLPPVFASDRDRIARFEREARAASALNHPNIVTVHDIGREDGVAFIVSELVEGETLAQMIERGPVPLRRLIEVGTQIAEGLAAAHAAGVVHRDLKPGNVMLTPGGRVKILDFGLARQDCVPGVESTTADISNPGAILGTPGYMSPEQVRGEPADARSDLFSLGVILYEMASGKPAFRGGSSIEVMNSILKDDPPELPPASPPSLDRIVRRCLEKEPVRRFQSAADLGFALQSSSPALPSAAAPKRRSRLKWAALAAFVVLTVAALFWLTRPLPPPQITATVQLTSDGRPKEGFLFTDGSRVFFTSASAGGTETYQVSVKEGSESITLPLPVKHAIPADISPDRTELLLCRYEKSDSTSCELWVAPLMGGAARRLGDLAAQDAAAAWSPDGQEVVYARDQELHIARIDGTEVRKLATYAGRPIGMSWSPDGSRVRFAVATIDSYASLWEARTDGNRAYPLLPGWKASFACCGKWTPDGKYFVFLAMVNKTVDLWAIRENVGWFPRAERGPFQLTNSPMSMLYPVPSPDGKRLFVVGSQPRTEFLRYDLKSGQLVRAFDGISGTELEFSKDGKWVAWISVPDRSLWRAAVDGSQRLRLTSPPFLADMPHWSPDGRQIAFFGSHLGSPVRIYVVSFDGGVPKQVTNGEGGKEGDADPSWSPDGASLAFGWSPRDATPAPGSASVHLVDLKTGRVSVLPGSEGMWSPRWSPDGRFIAGISASGSKVVLYDMRTQRQSELSSMSSGYPSWSRDGEYLFYSGRDGDEWYWWRMRMLDRKAERIAALKNMQVDDWFGQAPNNSLITARLATGEEIYALDWKAP